MICLFFVFFLQALYVSRKRKKEEDEQDSNSLLISLPLVGNTGKSSCNVVPDFESPMISAWHHDLTTSRSLDQLDLKDHRDLEEFTKRYYTHGHFATLKPTIAYIGKDQDSTNNTENHHEEHRHCDCSLHRSHHDLFY